MENFVITGGHELFGEVNISGAKNAAVAIIPAAILANDVVRIENIPQISDVQLIIEILDTMGAQVRLIKKDTIEIDTSNINYQSVPYELTSHFRASYYLIGAMLGRFKKAEVAMPGGCNFGVRPIDLHVKGFKMLGADVDMIDGMVVANADKLVGASVYMDQVSVGATINVMLAAVLARGLTIIENAAKEPHIVDLANFLNNMGANIRGAGTDTIKVKGVDSLHGGSYPIIPDQIEAGTFMIAAAATRGDIVLNNVIPRHLDIISAKLIEAGVKVQNGEDSVHVWVDDDTKFKHINFIALPYPGFPTDMQPQLVAFLSTVDGISTAREGVWDDRFRYVNELKRMGADIRVEGKLAIIDGIEKLSGACVRATDLRAGAAMIIAGLMADGITEITDIYHIDRGYENFDQKFIQLGGDIHRVTVVDESFD